MQAFSSLKLSVKPWFKNDTSNPDFTYQLVEIDKRNEAAAKEFVEDFKKKISDWMVKNELTEINPPLKTATCSYLMKINALNVEYYQVCIKPCANPHADCVAVRDVRAQKLAQLDGLCRQVQVQSGHPDHNIALQYKMNTIFNSLPTEKDIELICKNVVDPFKEYLSAAVYKIIVPKKIAMDNVAKYANADSAFNTINYKEARNYLNVECSRSRLGRAPAAATKPKKKAAAAAAPAAAAPLERPKMSKFKDEKHKKMFEAFSLFKDVYTNIANYDYDTYYEYVITSFTYVIVQNDRIIGFIGLWPEDKYEENPTFLEVKYSFIRGNINWQSMKLNIKTVLQKYYEKNKEFEATATIDEFASEEQQIIFKKMNISELINELKNPLEKGSSDSSLPLPASRKRKERNENPIKAASNENPPKKAKAKKTAQQQLQQQQEQQIRNMIKAQAGFNLRSIGANSETKVPEGFEKIVVKPNGWCFYNVIYVALTGDTRVLNSNEASNQTGLRMATEIAQWLRDNNATIFTFTGGIRCTFRQYYTDHLHLQEDLFRNTLNSRNVKETKFTYDEYLQATVDLQDNVSPSPRIFAQIEILGWAVAYMNNVNIDLYDKKIRPDGSSYTDLSEGYSIRPTLPPGVVEVQQTISILHTTMAHFDLLQSF